MTYMYVSIFNCEFLSFYLFVIILMTLFLLQRLYSFVGLF